jgi:AraC-like DNA-binding protein
MHQGGESFSIPSSYSRIVARELGLQERELPDLLQGTDLPVSTLLPGDETLLTGQQQIQVLVNARQISGADDIGLRIGRQLQPSSHGPIGYLALASPDLRSALTALQDYLPIRIRFAELELEETKQWLLCRLRLKLALQVSERQLLVECFTLLAQSLAESFLGREVTEAQAEFDYPPPGHVREYKNYVHATCSFNRGHNCFMIPAALAGEANASSDASSYAIARDLCRRLLETVSASTPSMTDRVRRYLLSQPPGSVSEDNMARAMYISKRTLARRLDQEKTGFRQIRDNVLSEMAMRHLQDTTLTVEAIAALLGYHDTANFRRAFRRWQGMPPNEFRQRSVGTTDPIPYIEGTPID